MKDPASLASWPVVISVAGVLLLGSAGASASDPGAAAKSSARDLPGEELKAFQSPDLSWWSVDGGGGTGSGGSFVLTGAAGEPEHGVSASSGFGFAGGVWATAPPSQPQIEVFADGFESGDPTAWSSWTPNP